MPVEIRQAVVDDYDDLYTAFSRIVGAGEGFPQQAPVTREEFDDYWIDHSAAVSVASTPAFPIVIAALCHWSLVLLIGGQSRIAFAQSASKTSLSNCTR